MSALRRFAPCRPLRHSVAAAALALLIAAWGLPGPAQAQEKPAANPFGEAPAKPEGEAQPEVNPFGAGPARKGAAKGPAPKLDLTKERPKTNAAIEVVIESKPSTPQGLAEAASTISMLGRPDLGKQYLAQFLAAKPDDAQMAALLEKFGSGFFLEMAARPDLAPEARQVANAVLSGANRFKSAPKRIAGLIGQLQDASADKRYTAMVGLLETGPAAIEPLVAVLADARRSAEHANARTVLAQFKSESKPVLVAALDAPDPALVVQAIKVLVEMNARDAAVHLVPAAVSPKSPAAVKTAALDALKSLVGRVPGRADAVAMLLGRAEEYFDHRQPAGRVEGGQVSLWQWDAAANRPVLKTYLPDDAANALAVRLARQAYAIAPEDAAVKRLLAAALLEAASYEAGLDRPLPDGAGTPAAEVAAMDVKFLEEVLRWTMSNGHPAAATATARILGRKGTAEQLLYSPEQPTPLALAARHGDRRLRMAALEAIAALVPQMPYPGSSYVPESLAWFAATTGQRRVLVAGTGTQKALAMAGPLSTAGYAIDAAPTGREAVRMALASPDYEFALLDVWIGDPQADMVLQYFRRDGRTAELPIGVIAHDGAWHRAEQLAERTPRSLAFYRPHDEKASQWQARQLGQILGRQFVPFEVRQAQAGRALELLAALGQSGARFYDLSRVQPVVLAALSNPALAPKAVAVLELLGTPQSQTALVETASRNGEPIALRQAAAAAFDASVRQRGILLSTAQIVRQYDRYNQSERLDPQTQAVLGSLLDSIEGPSQKLSAVEGPAEAVPAPEAQAPVPEAAVRTAVPAEK